MKKPSKKVVKKNQTPPVFAYTSQCCGASATKPACEKTEKADSSLGKFRCEHCGGRCKVSRSKAA